MSTAIALRAARTAALVLVSLAAAPAHSQVTLSPIVVTPTRFTEPAANAPIGTRIIGRDDIANAAARTLPDILAELGGVNVRNNFGAPDLSIDLRAMGVTGDQNTLVLLDGVRMNEEDLSSTRLSTIPLDSIERIEILPGGGAVQFGGGATGGTINIITRRAESGDRSASAFLGAGSYGTFDARLGGSLAAGNAGIAVFANEYDSDNYRRNNAVRQRNVLADLRWGLGDTTLDLKAGTDRQHLRLPGPLTEAQIAADPRQTRTKDNFSLRDGTFATLAGSTRQGSFTYAADVGYRETRYASFFKDEAFGLFDAYLEARLHRFNVSPRVRWQGGNQSVVVGFDHAEWDWDRRGAANSAGLASPTSRSAATQTNDALYAQWLGALAPGLRANAGWREQRSVTELDTLVPAGSATQRQAAGLSAGELGVRWNVLATTALSARLTKSFRVATVDENGFTLSGNLLLPQTAKGFDLGLEHRAGRATLRLVGYQTDLDNEIYFSPFAGAFGSNTNLPPTRRRGIEADASGKITATVDLRASVQLQQAKFREGALGGVDVAGRDVPLVPRQLASLRAGWMAMPRLRLIAVYTYVGHQYYDNDQANRFRRMPAYGTTDLKASYMLGGWTFAATVANVFDKKYYSYGIVDSATAPTSFQAYPLAGRTIFASAEYRMR